MGRGSSVRGKGRGGGGREAKLVYFSDISDRCDASEGKLINCFFVFFLIIYIFEKDKVSGEGAAQRQESHCANMATAALPGSSSHNISVSERWEKGVHTLNIQNKVQVLSDSSGSSHNNEGVYMWIRKYTESNLQQLWN